MKTEIVSYTLGTPHPLTDAQRANLKALSARQTTESTTATSALTDKQLKNAVRSRFYKPIKRQIAARIDADVLEGLRRRGRATDSASRPSCGGKCGLHSS